MEHFTCPGCGRKVIIDGKRVMHEVPECAAFTRKVNEVIGEHKPKRTWMAVAREEPKKPGKDCS